MTTLKKNGVVVPIDFSDISFTALETALEYVDHPSKVHILHVLEPLPVTEPGMMWNTVNNETRKQNVLNALHQKFNDPKFKEIKIDVKIGNPSEKIIDCAAELKADLIVIPSHGTRHGISRFLIGSVTERVIRFSKCPVLVLR